MFFLCMSSMYFIFIHTQIYSPCVFRIFNINQKKSPTFRFEILFFYFIHLSCFACFFLALCCWSIWLLKKFFVFDGHIVDLTEKESVLLLILLILLYFFSQAALFCIRTYFFRVLNGITKMNALYCLK